VKAQGIVYGAIKLIDDKGSKPGIEVFQQAVEKCRPLVEVKPRRVGGATLQVPVEVESRRGINLSMEWIVDAAKKRSGKSMTEKIAYEMMDAVSETGAAFKKKSDVHRMAEANKSYSHYRW
jgi:small subunit ribosomal protein S7